MKGGCGPGPGVLNKGVEGSGVWFPLVDIELGVDGVLELTGPEPPLIEPLSELVIRGGKPFLFMLPSSPSGDMFCCCFKCCC